MDEKNKYWDVLNQYKINWDDQEIINETNRIINENFEKNNNADVHKKIHSCIDLTSLNSTDTKEQIWKLTQKVNDFEGSSDLSNVAAICVYPNHVEIVREALTADSVKIVSVAGGFPASQTFTEIKIAETAMAVAGGAEEIDIVLNLGLFLDESFEELCEEINEIKHSCRNAKLKIILETGALKSASEIMKAAIISMYSGADFLKTSTGKEYKGATPEATYIICIAILEYYKKTGIKIGIKVSGGISNTENAVKHYTIVKEILGDEWCNNNLFRIGSSKLVDDILNGTN